MQESVNANAQRPRQAGQTLYPIPAPNPISTSEPTQYPQLKAQLQSGIAKITNWKNELYYLGECIFLVNGFLSHTDGGLKYKTYYRLQHGRF